MIFILIFALLMLHALTPFWWWVILLPFIYGVTKSQGAWRAFFSGFLSGGSVWLGAAWYFATHDALILQERLAAMSSAGSGSLLVLASGATGALCAALSCSAGYLLRAAIREWRVQEAAAEAEAS